MVTPSKSGNVSDLNEQQKLNILGECLTQIAPDLCLLMAPGDCYQVTVPVSSSIVIPNQKPKTETIIVMRPKRNGRIVPKGM